MCPLGFKGEKHVMTQEYVYDFAVDGGGTTQIVLSAKSGKQAIPVGAIIKAVSLKVLTAFTSGGSATLAVGNVTDDDGFLAAIAVAALTAGAVFTSEQQAGALLWDNTNDAKLEANVGVANDGRIGVKITTAAMTAGKAVIMVDYYIPGTNS